MAMEGTASSAQDSANAALDLDAMNTSQSSRCAYTEGGLGTLVGSVPGGSLTLDEPSSSSPMNENRSQQGLSSTRAASPSAPQVQRIRLVPVLGHQSMGYSNSAPIFERRLTSAGCIRIGRLDPPGSDDEITPIVFRWSKVVSRTHAVIMLDDENKWYVKDVSSSSGTFLNEERLSPAGRESARKPLSHGDILQFGMNYRGGVEHIYQAPRVRVELECGNNISRARCASSYNIASLRRLRAELASAPGTSNGAKLEDCAICLEKLRPGESLFIAPCAHGWHYRCIRPLVVRGYPLFQCPNCRSNFDLEQDGYDTGEEDCRGVEEEDERLMVED